VVNLIFKSSLFLLTANTGLAERVEIGL
jgi:hypothetical protein